MNELFNSLEPFPGANIAGLEIRCSVNRCDGVLSVSWELGGNRTGVALPHPADVPARKDELWKDTCFELFLAPRHLKNYWEFNISPSGDWNVYRFDAYREGMREEEAFDSLPIYVIHDEGSGEKPLRSISIKTDLGRLVPAASELDVAISAVIRGVDGKMSWWALVHRGPGPDFHRRDSFVMRR